MYIYVVYLPIEYEAGMVFGMYTDLDKAEDMKDIHNERFVTDKVTIKEVELDAEMDISF